MNDLEIMKFDLMPEDRVREIIFGDFKPLPNAYGKLMPEDEELMKTGLFNFKEDKMHNFKEVLDIEKNTLGDTRSAEKKPTMGEFDMANRIHRDDVSRVMYAIADLIEVVGRRHDDTKISHRDEFYSDFCYTLDHPKEKFEKSDWYQMHINTERHHIVARTPDNVDLIDVLEHIVDCCCAGKARNNGVIKPVVIPDDILQKAVENTVRMIDNNTRLVSHK